MSNEDESGESTDDMIFLFSHGDTNDQDYVLDVEIKDEISWDIYVKENPQKRNGTMPTFNAKEIINSDSQHTDSEIVLDSSDEEESIVYPALQSAKIDLAAKFDLVKIATSCDSSDDDENDDIKLNYVNIACEKCNKRIYTKLATKTDQNKMDDENEGQVYDAYHNCIFCTGTNKSLYSNFTQHLL